MLTNHLSDLYCLGIEATIAVTVCSLVWPSLLYRQFMVPPQPPVPLCFLMSRRTVLGGAQQEKGSRDQLPWRFRFQTASTGTYRVVPPNTPPMTIQCLECAIEFRKFGAFSVCEFFFGKYTHTSIVGFAVSTIKFVLLSIPAFFLGKNYNCLLVIITYNDSLDCEEKILWRPKLY